MLKVKMFHDSNLVKTNLHLFTKSVTPLVDAITVKEKIYDTIKHIESYATYTKLIAKSNNYVLFCFDESLVHPINPTLILIEKLGPKQAFQLAILDEENIDFLELINLDTHYIFEEYELVISVRLAQKNLVLIELSTRFITLDLENYELKEVLNLNSFDF